LFHSAGLNHKAAAHDVTSRSEFSPLVCPYCGADLRIVVFLTEAAAGERILTYIGEPPRPPPITPARGPPAWDDAPEPVPDWDLLKQPESDVEFDQRMTW